MREQVLLDVSDLPAGASGTANPTWWGTLAFMLIEGTGFALAIGVYLYLYSLAPEWPLGAPAPDLGPGTWVTAILLVSLVPNYLVSRWAKQGDLLKVRVGIILMAGFGIAPLVARAFEFGAVNVSWDANAYGSAVWILLGLHTTHILTDLADTIVLGALMWTRHGARKRRLADVQENAMYWNFVVLTWLPLYACIYGIARL